MILKVNLDMIQVSVRSRLILFLICGDWQLNYAAVNVPMCLDFCFGNHQNVYLFPFRSEQSGNECQTPKDLNPFVFLRVIFALQGRST